MSARVSPALWTHHRFWMYEAQHFSVYDYVASALCPTSRVAKNVKELSDVGKFPSTSTKLAIHLL
jgi:hypothetical protein